MPRNSQLERMINSYSLLYKVKFFIEFKSEDTCEPVGALLVYFEPTLFQGILRSLSHGISRKETTTVQALEPAQMPEIGATLSSEDQDWSRLG